MPASLSRSAGHTFNLPCPAIHSRSAWNLDSELKVRLGYPSPHLARMPSPNYSTISNAFRDRLAV